MKSISFCQLKFGSKCVAGKAAEAPNLIFPKWGAGAAFTRPSIAGTKWKQAELKCSVRWSWCAL